MDRLLQDISGLKVNSVERLLQGIEGLGVAVPAGQKLIVAIGDTVRVRATLDYRGPFLSDTFYGAIGIRGVWFDEVWVGSAPISFDTSFDWLTNELTVDIPVVTPVRPDTDYDLYVKLLGHPGAGMPEVNNVIDVIGGAEFRNFTIVSYDKV